MRARIARARVLGLCACARLRRSRRSGPDARRRAAVVAPGENLVVEGVPPIPASLADEVGRYTEFRSAGFSSWHPTRHEMLIATRFGNVTQAHLSSSPAERAPR